jgi:hypothetical protein
MRAWSTVDGTEYNIPFEISGPVLLYGGTGAFPWGSGVAYEWSMSAGLTYGTPSFKTEANVGHLLRIPFV